MPRRPRIAPLPALVAAISLASSAGAATPSDPRAAEALFAEGQAFMERGDYASACPKLEESYRLDEATGALHALALCHEAEGRIASAWVEFLEVAARANAEGNAEREREARERGDALRPKLSFLTVRVDAATAVLPGLEVSRNGVRLGPPAWGSPLPVDPGRHVVEARAPGYEPFRGTVEIGAEPRKEAIVVPRLARRKDISPAKPSGFEFTPLRVAGIGLGGAAVASFGVATYASLRAFDKYSDSESDCENNVCGVAGDRDRTSAEEAAHLATVSAVTGGVLLVSGAVLFLLGAPKTEGRVKTTAAPGGLRLEARF